MLAFRFRFDRIVSDRSPLWPPMLFAVSGLLIQLSNLLFPNIMAELKVDGRITALFQLVDVEMLIVEFVFLLLLFFWTGYSLMNQARVQIRKGSK